MLGIWANQETVKNAQNVVKQTYQSRYDLIEDLETIIRSKTNETATLELVVEAKERAKERIIDLNDSITMESFDQSQNTLSIALNKLLTLMETYPEINENPDYQIIRKKLEILEIEIKKMEAFLEDAIKAYIAYIKKFPHSLMVNFSPFYP